MNGVYGYLVPPGDLGALAGARRRLASAPDLRARMGARSAEMIAGYAPDLWASAFEDAVERIFRAPSVGSTS